MDQDIALEEEKEKLASSKFFKNLEKSKKKLEKGEELDKNLLVKTNAKNNTILVVNILNIQQLHTEYILEIKIAKKSQYIQTKSSILVLGGEESFQKRMEEEEEEEAEIKEKREDINDNPFRIGEDELSLRVEERIKKRELNSNRRIKRCVNRVCEIYVKENRFKSRERENMQYGRIHFALSASEHELYLTGGANHNHSLSLTQIFHIQNDTWTFIPNMIFPTSHHSSILFNHKSLFCFHGFIYKQSNQYTQSQTDNQEGSDQLFSNLIQLLDLNENHWQIIELSNLNSDGYAYPAGVGATLSQIDQDSIIIFGGISNSEQSQETNLEDIEEHQMFLLRQRIQSNVWMYNHQTQNIISINSPLFFESFDSAVKIDDYVFAFAKNLSRSEDGTYTPVLYVYQIHKKKWLVVDY